MVNQGEKTRSIMDLPNEVIEIIARSMHADTLASFSTSNDRLREIARRVIERLRVPFINMHLLSFLEREQYGASVQFLDLSNCHADSETIQSVILACLFVKELNVVNSGLGFLHLLNAVGRLDSLKKLSFSLLERLEAKPPQEVFPVCRSLQDLYLETTTLEIFTLAAMSFINNCEILQKLHINLIGERRENKKFQVSTRRTHLQLGLGDFLNTVIVSRHASGLLQPRFILNCLFENNPKQFFWRRQLRSCYIYENGNFNMFYSKLRNGSVVLRDALYVELHPVTKNEQELPWGAPRGLKLVSEPIFETLPFEIPASLDLSVLKELDLTDCYAKFAKNVWTQFLVSSPNLEALAINMDYLVKNAKVQNPSNAEPSGSDSKQPGLEFNFLKSLRRVRLKRLWIKGSLRYLLYCKFSSRSFSGLRQLSHLEELTLYRVSANAEIFEALAHENIRTVRLHLLGFDSVRGLKDMIERSPKLKFFKLELPKLQLDCDDLWNAFTSGEHVLEQICLATASREAVTVDTLVSHLPELIQQLSVLHIHADSVSNCAELDEQVSPMMERYVEDNPYRNFQFLPVTQPSLSDIEFADVTASFPGRSLCATAHYIARVKADGWDLR